MAIGKLQKVPLRELWKHEAKGFSAWLENHIEILSEALGFPLTVVQREHQVGAFKLDLIARNEDRGDVIIENQLEATDHDHLGKVLTYTSNLGAKTGIWITSEPRAEHVKAIEWLNETTPADVAFFLVQLEAYRIGRSDSAPYFKIVVGPNKQTKEFGEEKKELAKGQVLCMEFWKQLLARAKQKGVMLHANRSGTRDMWIAAGAGVSGLSFNYVIWREGKAAVELYIDVGDKQKNKRIFDKLRSYKKKIETLFRAKLDWERLEDRRASRLRYWIRKGGLRDEARWQQIQDAMIEAMARLEKALKSRIDAIQ